MNVLRQRKLLNFVSSDALFKKNLAGQACYIGFDPTAESIHLGNFMGLLALTHLRLQGVRPIILFGGATGLIGDPSGRATERQLLTLE